jgi:hypothetical protein
MDLNDRNGLDRFGDFEYGNGERIGKDEDSQKGFIPF